MIRKSVRVTADNEVFPNIHIHKGNLYLFIKYRLHKNLLKVKHKILIVLTNQKPYLKNIFFKEIQ